MATTNNNQIAVRMYQKQFMQLMQTVFQAQSAFSPAFGELQAHDGVQNKDIAFYVKTNDLAVVIGEYSTDENTAFGSGTGNSSRFGERKEIIYADTDVPYTFEWAIHEGLDRYTVNTDLDAAVADRLNLQAQAKTRFFNVKLGKALVEAASEDLGSDLSTGDKINAAFETVVQKFTDLEIVVPARAYVTADIYNAIIDYDKVTNFKGSKVNIDENGILSFRGITVNKTPARYMDGKQIIFAPDNIGHAFIGIVTTRTIESEDFDGVALQGAGKGGTFILDDNKAAIFTAGATEVTGITLSQKTASIKVGATKQVTVSAEPATASNASSVVSAAIFASSDTNVATVATDGTITGVAAGTATITATSGDFTATVAVTVTEA
ncbi:Ig-like domain-containing protein [Ligilactobacillus sp. WILCCON 0076]|uniref:Ig-like domain-containing protein n=1 Tax=Ligilactobacillus ubinensis TaxID=2876789 RepID=A0A9X2JK07_9LACO|nr:Ig-like domain-containing protein [Ligilactobacillus ubinensis]MCP0885913.1 Ig-like domain-containing protein [Ligilactobacillus ubinensis]